MKTKIANNMHQPLLAAYIGSMLICGIPAILILALFTQVPLILSIVMVPCAIFFTVRQPLRRAAWVYSNLQRHHLANYHYELGNGTDTTEAKRKLERKVQAAAAVWIRRNYANRIVLAIPLMTIIGGTWMSLLYSILAIACMLLTIVLAVYMFVITSRKLAYDNYGNPKKS